MFFAFRAEKSNLQSREDTPSGRRPRRIRFHPRFPEALCLLVFLCGFAPWRDNSFSSFRPVPCGSRGRQVAQTPQPQRSGAVRGYTDRRGKRDRVLRLDTEKLRVIRCDGLKEHLCED
jgi:hypothetical protein